MCLLIYYLDAKELGRRDKAYPVRGSGFGPRGTALRIWSESAPELELDRGDRHIFVAPGFLEVDAGAVHQVVEAVGRRLEGVLRHLPLSPSPHIRFVFLTGGEQLGGVD